MKTRRHNRVGPSIACKRLDLRESYRHNAAPCARGSPKVAAALLHIAHTHKSTTLPPPRPTLSSYRATPGFTPLHDSQHVPVLPESWPAGDLSPEHHHWLRLHLWGGKSQRSSSVPLWVPSAPSPLECQPLATLPHCRSPPHSTSHIPPPYISKHAKLTQHPTHIISHLPPTATHKLTKPSYDICDVRRTRFASAPGLSNAASKPALPWRITRLRT